jgi:hypothetical protein
MALSPSTIVLGLATASVFGYAVRDQVKNGKPSPFKEINDEYSYRRSAELDEEQMEERMAAYREAEQARREARERLEAEQAKLESERTKMRKEAAEQQMQKDKARDVRELSKLFGAARASFGGALAGTRIGMTTAELKPKLEAVNQVTEPLHAQETLFDDAGDVLRSVTIRPGIGCNDLAAKVEEMWGVGKKVGGRTYWSEDASGMRVVLDKSHDRSCQFQFERFAPVDRWLSSTVPSAFLGRSDVELMTEIKRRPTVHGVTMNDTSIIWSDIGVGVGRGGSDFKARVAKGKVTAIEVTVDDGDEALTARLKAVYGKPVDPEASPLTWTRPYYISWDTSTLTLSTVKPEVE